ncbi:uncharacterized protein LOC18429100 [Amborella trichopoda]|nr:uncharacterized protein LOC18429100 [Amborella trichopoda]|eukprot:XP_020519785.1 uncharacterized protein LOC18429100 [Amborella trichopoda]
MHSNFLRVFSFVTIHPRCHLKLFSFPLDCGTLGHPIPFKPKSSMAPPPPPPPASRIGLSLEEWQGWGTSSPVPAMVNTIFDDLRALEREMDEPINFSGPRGKLQGEYKYMEDRKHREAYDAMTDSEEKLQFFSARQISCRLLGSRGYLCQKCWLASTDCMCSNIVNCSLWNGLRFWVYMHPKDFLRQNNTGKLLWQIFGVQSACLCLFGVREHEESMWSAFQFAGKCKVWCLYPDQHATTQSIEDIGFPNLLASSDSPATMMCQEQPVNFVLIDGTWNNSAAMFRRLKQRARIEWGTEDFPCLSFPNSTVSVMHKLRPQPSWDRTCTAAAAVQLLSELSHLPSLESKGLDKQAEALGNALVVLLDALINRRKRMGRSITRRERSNNNRSYQKHE